MVLNDIFKKDNVCSFFKDIVRGVVYKDKEIPNTISDEKIDVNYYAILIGLDAIIKYVIIVDDNIQFDNYLEQVKLLLRKVINHNEIKNGINKLIINFCQKKLKISNIKDIQNKEIILKYIYQKYIIDGYFFHSFPSVFQEDVLNCGLVASNYNYEINSLKEVNDIFDKYKVNNVFSKELNCTLPYITVSDSPFMGCYYAYHSPYFLNEICTNLLNNDAGNKKDAFFEKNYKLCRKNLSNLMNKKGFFSSDIASINSFLEREWDLFQINSSRPMMCLIKRSYLKNNSLKDINSIVEKIREEELIVSVTKVLETRFNEERVFDNIPNFSFNILSLPTLEELGIEVSLEDKKQLEIKNKKDEFINDYGNTTIIALLGVLFITIGITITLIMIGR